MLPELLAKHHGLPNVWGEGAIFASSGLDGATSVASGFVATYARNRYGLLFHTPQRRFLDVELGVRGTPRIATGDVLAVESQKGTLLMAYSAWHTLVGSAPAGMFLRLRFEDGPNAAWIESAWVTEGARNHDVLALVEAGGRFALSYGRSADEAIKRAKAGLQCDPWGEAARRLTIYQKVPAVKPVDRERLLKKCVSVIKVNALSAEGAIKGMWSTPDRVPHKDMWLWDSVFHSLAMNHLYPEVAWQFLKSVLETRNAEGMIPHQSGVSGKKSHITQPPILAWGVWENYQFTHDKSALQYALPRLEAYLRWDLANRDRNGNGLLEWLIEGDVRCRSGESGLDNSPRFDRGLTMDAVDFSSWAAMDMQYMGRIAQELGDTAKAKEWLERSQATSAKVHEYLWDARDGFYYDRALDGEFSRIKAASGFMPLLLDDLPADHLGALVKALQDPNQFGTAFPVPSLAVCEPAWSTDMWRGPTWANLNYFIILGLLKHGRADLAGWLADRTIHYVQKYYELYGVTFEFFDSKDQVPPPACDRKGLRREPYDIRRKLDSIRDYHWTAAVTALLLLAER